MESFDITLQYTEGKSKYPAKSHARRTAARLGAKSGLIVLHGSKSGYYDHSDEKVPFRQDRYFYYLSGCNEPDCGLTYDIDSDFLSLHLPPVDYRRFFYDGRSSTIEEAMERYDIDEAVYTGSGDELLSHRLATSVDCYCLSTSGSTELPSPLQQALDYCRALKDQHEIELIRTANDISAAAHRDVLLRLHNLGSETEAEAVYIQRCLASGAKEQAYGPIFGSGPNASFLHYIDNDALFNDSQLLLIDAGCEWQLYASDVTRTIPLNKKRPGYWPSDEARLLYKAVESIQERCINMISDYVQPRCTPGNHFQALHGTLDFNQLNNFAVDAALEALLSLGVLKGDPDDIKAAGTTRAFFPHGLGHHMGLEVHDPPPPPVTRDGQRDLGALKTYWKDVKYQLYPHLDRRRNAPGFVAERTAMGAPPFQSGHVITIEPGLYFNKFFLERFVLPDKKHSQYIDREVLERYMPLGGVRIEDDILITEAKGKLRPVNLTTAAKGEEMLAILRTAAKKST